MEFKNAEAEQRTPSRERRRLVKSPRCSCAEDLVAAKKELESSRELLEHVLERKL